MLGLDLRAGRAGRAAPQAPPKVRRRSIWPLWVLPWLGVGLASLFTLYFPDWVADFYMNTVFPFGITFWMGTFFAYGWEVQRMWIQELPRKWAPWVVGAAILGLWLSSRESAYKGFSEHLTQLAEARARPGKQCDLEAAAGLGLESLDLAESLDSTRGTDLLRDLYLRLKPYAKVPAVRDFLERAKGLVKE